MNRQRIYETVGVIVLLLAVVGVVVLVNSGSVTVNLGNLLGGKKAETQAPAQQAPASYVPKDGTITQVVIPLEKQADAIVDITSAGFSPDGIIVPFIITKGTVVIWTNRDKTPHWVYNSTYPERGTCGTKFDSCAGLKLGESLRVTFTRAGIWDYVDKLNSKFTGRVIVQ